jgi:hypothetical protein
VRLGGVLVNRAFLIVGVPVALVVIGYCLVFWRAGIALPWGELLAPLLVLLGAMLWWLGRRAQRKQARQ